MEDATLYHSTFDTTGVNCGTDADVTKVTATTFKEVGSNPGGIADWEAKWDMLQDMRRAELRARRVNLIKGKRA